jgi:hypothetical protein
MKSIAARDEIAPEFEALVVLFETNLRLLRLEVMDFDVRNFK